ncbi:MAG: 50S ribosomal protein L4 [Metamycoplasmataceae bacterium]
MADKVKSTEKDVPLKEVKKSSSLKIGKAKTNKEKLSKEEKNKKVKKNTSAETLFENKVQLPKELFGIEKINNQAIFDTILFERNSKRQGTHAVKTRATVSGTGKKPWKQKGTGRARAGTLRSPVFVGGGRAFGPQVERNYEIKVNKKVRKLAYLSALTMLANEKLILVTENFKMEKPKTKDLIQQLSTWKVDNKRHILLVSTDENVFKSAANLKNIYVVKPFSITVEDLLWTDALVMSEEILKIMEGVNK